MKIKNLSRVLFQWLGEDANQLFFTWPNKSDQPLLQLIRNLTRNFINKHMGKGGIATNYYSLRIRRIFTEPQMRQGECIS